MRMPKCHSVSIINVFLLHRQTLTFQKGLLFDFHSRDGWPQPEADMLLQSLLVAAVGCLRSQIVKYVPYKGNIPDLNSLRT